MDLSDSTSSRTYPRRRSDLAISPIEIEGVEYFTVKDPVNGSFYRLRAPEIWLLERLDGETPPRELAARFNLKFDTKLTDTDIGSFVGHLSRLNLTVASVDSVSTSKDSVHLSGAPTHTTEYLHRPKQFRLTEIYFGTIDPSRLIGWLTEIYRPFHSLAGLCAALAVLVFGLTVFSFNLSAFSLSYELVSKGSSLLTLIIAMFVMISIHEFAHAVLLTYFGGQVTRMGFMLLFFQPCFYCDVSDAWTLRSASQRMAVSASGLIAQLLILAIGAIVWRVTEPSTFISHFAQATVVVSWLNFFFNFNPLIRLDGYYFLLDYWGIPNLRDKSFARLGQSIQRVLGLQVSEPTWEATQDRRLFWFGLSSFVFSNSLIVVSIWFFGGLAGKLFGTEGLLLYSVVVAAILAPTMWRVGSSVASYTKQIMTGKLRSTPSLIAAIFALPLLGLFFAYPMPHTTGGTISVRALRTFEIRLTDAGLLEREEQQGGAHPSRQTSFLQLASNDIAAITLVPKVADGARVRIGDTIAIFASNEVTRQLGEADAELARLQSELALIKAPPKKERVAEAQSQIESAKADLDQKRRDLIRSESLSVRGLLPTAQLESNRTAVSMAEATLRNRESTFRLIASPPRPEEESVIVNEIDKQQSRMTFLRTQADAQLITSPINGIALVTRDGQRVLSVHATDSLEVTIPVIESDLPLVWLQQEASIKVRSHADTVFTGTVVRVPVIASQDSTGGSFLVGVLVSNENGKLREGMDGYGKIKVGEISPAGLLWRKLMSAIRVEFWGIW